MVTHRGHIKKIKFGPGRGNNKLAALYSDGIDIWDLQKVGYSGGSRGEVQGALIFRPNWGPKGQNKPLSPLPM